MKHIVKIMADGQANEVEVEAETHADAVMSLAATFADTNQKCAMMSESVTIYNERGIPEYEIKNRLCDNE